MLDHKLEQKIEHLDQKVEQLRSEFSHMHNDLVECMSDGETRLLKAFMISLKATRSG